MSVPAKLCSTAGIGSASIDATDVALVQWSLSGAELLAGKGDTAIRFQSNSDEDIVLSAKVTLENGSIEYVTKRVPVMTQGYEFWQEQNRRYDLNQDEVINIIDLLSINSDCR